MYAVTYLHIQYNYFILLLYRYIYITVYHAYIVIEICEELILFLMVYYRIVRYGNISNDIGNLSALLFEIDLSFAILEVLNIWTTGRKIYLHVLCTV